MTDPQVDAEHVSLVGEPDHPGLQPNIGHVLLIALVGGVFAVLWLVAYEKLNDLIWNNSFVASNRWVIPVGVVFFSLLVGLVVKYLHAPTVIEGGAGEVLKAENVSIYKTFWGTLLSSFFSLFSGASVGPEGPLGFLAIEISQWIAAKLKFHKQGALLASLAGMSSAYNGIVGNPVFSGVFVSEINSSQQGFVVIGSNLAAGVVGFLVFALLGVPAFAGFLNIGQPVGITLAWVAWAIALGLIGALLAVYIGIAFRGAGRVMSTFKDRVIERIVVAGLIVGVVSYFIPDLMFSGETQIHSIMANPAQFGVGMLLLMALLKPMLLALSLKSGYLGGPIFPSLFTAVMVALAISLLVPEVPVSILVPCLEVAVVTLLLKAPLTSILLVTVVSGAGASPDLIGLIVVASVTSMIVGQLFQGLVARRATRRGSAEPATSADA